MEARALHWQATNIIINEVDADTPGTDTAEFVELYDNGAGNTALDGLTLVLYNGSNDQSYYALDLDGYRTDANGYLSVDYGKLTPILLVAIKELNDKLNTLQNDNAALKAKVESIDKGLKANGIDVDSKAENK